METKAMYLSSYEEQENVSFYKEGFDGVNSRSLSKLNLCEESPANRRRKADNCCAHINSLSSIKYAIVLLYVLVLLSIVGLFIAGPGKLVKIEGKMDAAKYREILEENLLKSARDLGLGKRLIFQQDNNPKHTAKATLEWLKNKKVNVLKWPSQSPGLNPTENMWKELKIAVHQRSPSNLTELEQFCKEEWTKIAVSRCAKLVKTYPNRLMAIIAAKGASTKY